MVGEDKGWSGKSRSRVVMLLEWVRAEKMAFLSDIPQPL